VGHDPAGQGEDVLAGGQVLVGFVRARRRNLVDVASSRVCKFSSSG